MCACAGGPKYTVMAEGVDQPGIYQPNQSAKLIPKILHQTYMSRNVPAGTKALMTSWRRYNPDWEIRSVLDCSGLRCSNWPMV